MNTSIQIASVEVTATVNEPQITLRNILAPVDFSGASRAGLSFAEKVADRFGARIELLYVVEPPRIPQWGYAYLSLRDLKMKEQAEERLPDFAIECRVNPRRLGRCSVEVGD